MDGALIVGYPRVINNYMKRATFLTIAMAYINLSAKTVLLMILMTFEKAQMHNSPNVGQAEAKHPE